MNSRIAMRPSWKPPCSMPAEAREHALTEPLKLALLRGVEGKPRSGLLLLLRRSR